MIHFSTSFKEFLISSERRSKNRIAILLNKAINHWRYRDARVNIGEKDAQSCANIFDKLFTNSEIDYLTFRRDGTISFLPKGKKHVVTSSGEWAKDGRQNGKPSKVIQKLFTKNGRKLFKDTEFESFSNQYKLASVGQEGLRWELLPSSQIPRIYDTPRSSGEGSLNGSCMYGAGKEGYVDIYKECERLQVLCLWDEHNHLAGRALVWNIHDKKTKEDLTLIDRFYVTKEFMFDMFKEYAEDKGWWRKEHYKTFDHKNTFRSPAGELVERNFRVDTPTNFDRYPYIDTFSFGGEGFLSNYSNGCKYDYANTGGRRGGGERSDSPTFVDFVDGESYPLRQRVVIQAGDHIGESTRAQNTVDIHGSRYWKSEENQFIEHCDWDGDWYLRSEMVTSDYMTERTHHLDDDGEPFPVRIPMERAVFSNIHNSWIPRNRSVSVTAGDGLKEIYHHDDISRGVIRRVPGSMFRHTDIFERVQKDIFQNANPPEAEKPEAEEPARAGWSTSGNVTFGTIHPINFDEWAQMFSPSVFRTYQRDSQLRQATEAMMALDQAINSQQNPGQ